MANANSNSLSGEIEMKNEVIGYLKKLHDEECFMQSTICPGREVECYQMHERNKMYLEFAIRKLEGKLNANMDSVVEMNTQATGIGNMSGKEEFQCTISMSGMFKEQLEAEAYFKSRMFDTVVGAMTDD